MPACALPVVAVPFYRLSYRISPSRPGIQGFKYCRRYDGNRMLRILPPCFYRAVMPLLSLPPGGKSEDYACLQKFTNEH